MTRHRARPHKRNPICCCSRTGEGGDQGGPGTQSSTAALSAVLTMVGCGHRSEAGAGKKHVWKRAEPPHPKPAPPASARLSLPSGWPPPHWQSTIRVVGGKKHEEKHFLQKKSSFQCHSTSHLGSELQVSCRKAVLGSLSHRAGLCTTKRCLSAL